MALEAYHHPHSQACRGGGVGNTSNAARATLVALELLPSRLASTTVDLDVPPTLQIGWERCLDLRTGKIFYRKGEEMSRNNGKSPKVDLRLNPSQPPRGNSSRAAVDGSPNGSSSSSSPSSCVSSEAEQGLRYCNSPEATSMVLAGCPRCLMYVMLSEEDPKCPKCKSPVLLDFHHDSTTKKTRKS